MGGRGHRSKHLCNLESIGNQWESEAPAELFTPRFGRSLTLPPVSIQPLEVRDCGIMNAAYPF